MKQAPPLDPDNPHSAVYLAARREWNERYGDYIAQARTWRVTALASLGIAVVAVGGVVWMAAQSRIVPYVVQTDRLGDAIAISRADVAPPADPRLIRAQLGRWVANVRSVYADIGAQKRVIVEAYSMVDRNSGGVPALNEWFAAHDPFRRAQDTTVAVAVDSVLPLSANVWRIEWREDIRTRQGMPASLEFWQATVTVSVNPPTSDAAVLANPVGLFVESFNWSQRPGVQP